MYVSCLPLGGLGNQLFIIISAWAYAKNNNLKKAIKHNTYPLL